MLQRLFYIAYYFKNLDWSTLRKFMDHASELSGKSKIRLWRKMLQDSLRFNISLLEYFQFHFYELPEEEKKKWAGTGYMYEYQLKMNPKPEREVLEDKSQFLVAYEPFVKHPFATIQALKNDLTNAI